MKQRGLAGRPRVADRRKGTRPVGGFPHERLLNPKGLNMAEIELSVLSRQCLNRRIPDMATLKKEVAVWCDERNEKETWIDWRFTTEDARIKLKRLYPSLIN